MRFIWMIFLSFGLAGCAPTNVYNPMQVAEYPPELLLNESGLKAVHEGMTPDQVHQTMGQQLVIGYAYQAPDYKPLTIPNPYKTEEVKDTGYTIEYYIDSIRQTDGVIHDNELMPLVFKDGKLVGRGWSLANSIRPPKPAS
jgi:hypothetical protein